MSDAPHDPLAQHAAQNAAQTGADAGVDPQNVVGLRAVIDPAAVRRAPRYAAFLGAGVVVGVLLGLALGLYLLSTFDPARDQPLTKPGVWLTVTVFGMTTVTALLGGALAVVLDRRSLRRWEADNAPRQDDSHAV